jgi:cytoplasmic iron level regulating protein YaaA (DUF328/UPF0246 family)
MLVLLSPAKDLSDAPVSGVRGTTKPRALDLSVPIAAKLRGMSPRKLGTLMDISPKLAELNHARFAAWAPPFTVKNAIPAAFTFNGEAYRGLDARTLDADDLRFAQHHLRILSGLYGALRPLDLIQAYRLEMGTKLGIGRAKDLYAYWRNTITEQLNADLAANEADVVVNLASTEYFKAVDTAALKANVVTPVFKDRSASGSYKVVMVFAKHQRGAMARYIIRHRILEPVLLKRYNEDGYHYAPEESTAQEWVFLRDRT